MTDPLPAETARRKAGTEKILHDEEWKSERILNVFRCFVWGGGGLFGIGAGLWTTGIVPPAVMIVLAWGILCVVYGVFFLPKLHDRRIPILITTLDLTVAGLAMDMLHVRILAQDLPRALHQLYGSAIAVFMVVATNVLRFSPGHVLWSVAYGAAVYGWLLVRHGRMDFRYLLDVFFIGCFGGLLVYSTYKFRRVIRRVKERDAFARFLPSTALDRVSEDPMSLSLGGEEQEATVLFADIRDFTALSSTLSPPRVLSLLNEYFEQMVDEIFRREGILDKFIGDGICAVFGPPLSSTDQARRAIQCGLGMLRRLDTINAVRAARGEPALRMGIGIHSGKVLAGNVGTSVRMEYTHIGDTMNTASRIEGLCKELGACLIASRGAFERSGGSAAFEAKTFDPVPVKGKPEPLHVVEILREV
jgi:adenylate cyclase